MKLTDTQKKERLQRAYEVWISAGDAQKKQQAMTAIGKWSKMMRSWVVFRGSMPRKWHRD